MPIYALDNADIVREAILQKLRCSTFLVQNRGSAFRLVRKGWVSKRLVNVCLNACKLFYVFIEQD